MTFGEALFALKDGKAVARRQWEADGSTAFLVLIQGRVNVPAHGAVGAVIGNNSPMTIEDHIDMIDMDLGPTRCNVGWQPLQCDILAEDWVLVEL